MLISDWSSDVCSSDLFLAGLLVEGVDVDIADLALRLPLHGAKLDDLALYSDVERLVPPRPHDRELDRAAGRAAHLVDRFVPRAAIDQHPVQMGDVIARSEEHTSELQSLMSTSYAVFCLQQKKHKL